MTRQDTHDAARERYAEAARSGSGGGLDVLLSARHDGPTGTAHGLDMVGDHVPEGWTLEGIIDALDGAFASAFVRATKES